MENRMTRSKRPDFVEVQAAPYPHVVRLYQDEALYIEAVSEDGLNIDPGDVDDAYGLSYTSADTEYIFVLPGKARMERQVVFIHDLLHGTFDRLKGCGIDPTSNTGEVSTYLQGCLFASRTQEL